MVQEDILLQWQEPTFVIFKLPDFSQHVVLAQGVQLRRQEVWAYLASVRGILGVASVLTCIALPLLFFYEPNTTQYKVALQVLVIGIGIHIFLRILLQMVGLAFRSHKPEEVFYRLSRQELVCTKGGKLRKRFRVSEIRRVQLKEVRYQNGQIWMLRIKHKNRIWYELGIPEELRAAAQRAFDELSVPFGISTKPARGWFRKRWFHTIRERDPEK